MENSEGAVNNKPVFGDALQKVFAERGCHITLEQSEQLARVLLKAAAASMLVPIDRKVAALPHEDGADLT